MSSTLSPPVLSTHPVDIGHRSEAAIWGRLVRHGYAVLLPCGVNQRYDLVIDDPKAFLRVQCKTGRLKKGVIEFSTCSTRSNTHSAMARDYVLEHPPSSPVLLHYGRGFADFVAGFAPAASLPYLADIVRLEDAQVQAYHAQDISPIDARVITRIAPDRLANVTFVFHPAASTIRSSHPIVTIWSMNSGEQLLAPIDNWQAEDALVTRPELAVFTRQITPGSAVFVLALMRGTALGQAFEEAVGVDEQFDLGRNLADLLRSGAVTDIITTPSLEA